MRNTALLRRREFYAAVINLSTSGRPYRRPLPPRRAEALSDKPVPIKFQRSPLHPVARGRQRFRKRFIRPVGKCAVNFDATAAGWTPLSSARGIT